MLQNLKNIINNENGSIATTIGIIAVPLTLCCGVAIDYSSLHKTKSSLQEAADTAALASAKELSLASTKDETVKSIANDYVIANLQNNLGNTKNVQTTKIKTSIADSRKEVTVDIAHTWTPLFIQHIDSTALPIKVSSTASLAGERSICVLALDQNASTAIDMISDATMIANDCVIYSNSSSGNGIATGKKADMRASEIMSSGGYIGPIKSYSPMPLTDTPMIEDPLKDREQPPVGTMCTKKGFSTNKDVTLDEGVYCGGLELKGNAIAKLNPGEYIIKDGPLKIGGSSSLIGEGVSFFFTGKEAVFEFGVPTKIELSAQKSGTMAGILFFEDRNSPKNRQFKIRSKNAKKFEGAIYLSKGILNIDKASKVGQESAWTAIIANQIIIGNGPEIQINSDYANSTTPVPEAISGGTSIRLKR